MAASGPGQNATVEEILASIRQAISDDDARRTGHGSGDVRGTVERTPPPPLTPKSDEQPEVTMSDDSDAPSALGPGVDQGVIEMAIEQALDGVRAEFAGRKTAATAARARPRQEIARTAAEAVARVPPPRMAPVRREIGGAARKALVSPKTDAQVSASFDELAKAMIEGNATKLDEVVEDLLRPMLRSWLDENLPQMVERMVREEIERVARSSRR